MSIKWFTPTGQHGGASRPIREAEDGLEAGDGFIQLDRQRTGAGSAARLSRHVISQASERPKTETETVLSFERTPDVERTEPHRGDLNADTQAYFDEENNLVSASSEKV